MKTLSDNCHVHCFCEKKRDYTSEYGERLVTMSCHKCGLQRDYTAQGKERV